MKWLVLGGVLWASFLYGSEDGSLGYLPDPGKHYPHLYKYENPTPLRRSKRKRKEPTYLTLPGEEESSGEAEITEVKPPAKKKRKKDTGKSKAKGKGKKKSKEVDLFCDKELDIKSTPYFLKGLMALAEKKKFLEFYQLYGGLKELGFNAFEYQDDRGTILRNYIINLDQDINKYELRVLAGIAKQDSDTWMFNYLKHSLKIQDTGSFIRGWKGLREVGIDPWKATNKTGHSLFVVAMAYKNFAAFKHMALDGPNEVSKKVCLKGLKLDIEGMIEAEKQNYRKLLLPKKGSS